MIWLAVTLRHFHGVSFHRALRVPVGVSVSRFRLSVGSESRPCRECQVGRETGDSSFRLTRDTATATRRLSIRSCFRAELPREVVAHPEFFLAEIGARSCAIRGDSRILKRIIPLPNWYVNDKYQTRSPFALFVVNIRQRNKFFLSSGHQESRTVWR